LILRKSRVSQKAREVRQTQVQQESKTSPAEEYRPIGYGYGAPDESFDEETPLLLQEMDPEDVFYHKWGYLPPLDEEAIAVIQAITANPGIAKDYTRIGPELFKFPSGLEDRNVSLTESRVPDLRADEIKSLILEESFRETDGEMESHEQLWALDQAKCNEGSNEALFQRTAMMNLIARHHLIYGSGATHQSRLDFSVEETWGCPPMPTRAYQKGEKFLTQPKPNLSVCFHRQALIPDNL
jgi:hypothetical protein